jgi:hypothetical protein
MWQLIIVNILLFIGFLVLEGLLNENVNVLRVGQPGKTNKALLSSTLEYKMEQHENFREISELKDKLHSLFESVKEKKNRQKI